MNDLAATRAQIAPQAALTRLIPRLTRLARLLAPTPDKAEDMVQDALLSVWTRLQDGAQIDDLGPYLMTVLRNRSRHPLPAPAELTEQNAGSTPGQADQRLACLDVGAAIERLPDDQAALLRSLYLSGASYRDLALAFDVPIGTVMSRLARARTRLRADLDLPARGAVPSLLENIMAG